MPGRGEKRPEGGGDLEKQEAVLLRESFTLRFVDGAPEVDEGGRGRGVAVGLVLEVGLIAH
jgi:hypothetical protein